MNKTQIIQTAPFVDLAAQHMGLEGELVAVLREALREGRFIGGPAVEAFEANFAAFCGTAHCAGVANGTDALRLALVAAGVRPGDTVVTVANTFAATVEAIRQAGALPAFVDIDETTFNMDAARLSEYLEARCRMSAEGRPFDRKSNTAVTAVVPVHLYGQPPDMDPILDTARRHGLKVVEDACQAHGAEYYSALKGGWKMAGSLGDAAAFSFYPCKNLGACGDGGAVTTNDPGAFEMVRMLRDHGQSSKYFHEIEGCNSRLDAIQAGFLDIKLRRLSVWNGMRRACAAHYGELLSGAEGIVLPKERPNTRPAYHLYVVRVKDRDALQERLSEAGVSTGLHYPVPLHLQNAYRGLGYKRGDLPATEKAAGEVLSLPMYPGLGSGQQQRVARLILGPP